MCFIFLFLTLMTLSTFGDTIPSGEVLHSLNEIFHPSAEAIALKQPFEIDGYVNFYRRSDNSFSFQDGTADSAFRCPTGIPAESLVGCHVRVSGQIRLADQEIGYAQATNIVVLSREPLPPVKTAKAIDLLNGKHLGQIVRLKGLISDLRKDDLDPDWTLLTLVSDNETVGCCLREDLTSSELEYIGAEVAINGHCARLIPGHRHFMGPVVFLTDQHAISILKKPPEDPFSVSPLEEVDNVTPRSIASRGCRRTTGRVLAVWDRYLLLRTEYNDTCRVTLMDVANHPRCGQVIDVMGLPNTDLYHLNLYRARWRPSDKILPDSEPPPIEMTAGDMLVDADGHKRIRFRYHGRQIRLRGKVITLPHPDGAERVLSLNDGRFTVPVIFSSCPEILNDLPVGASVEVTGVCLINTLSPSPIELVPGIGGFSIILRRAEDLRVLSRPPWWTPTRLILLVGVLLSILSGVLFWNVLLRRAAERQGRELARESIARTAADLRVLERTRLAVELHDTLVQNMTGIAVALRTQNYSLAAKTLDFCRKDLRNCLWDLRNLTLDDADISSAIRKTLAPHAVGLKLRVRFNVPRGKFTDNSTHAILCMLRELTINAVRHGGATSLWIAGSTEGEKMLISVRDNGCGFNPESVPGMDEGHFGLQGIRDRVEGFDGDLKIESSSGQGTKITITLDMSSLKDQQLS